MAEVRCQRRVTEGYVEGVRVVGHGHQLRGRRLAGISAVAYPRGEVVARLEEEHGLRREVPPEVVVHLRAVCFGHCIVLGGAVVCPRGYRGEAELRAHLLSLVHDVGADLLALLLVDYLVGVVVVYRSPVVEVVGGLVGQRTAPVVGVVGLEEEALGKRLGIGKPAPQGGGLLQVVEALVDALEGLGPVFERAGAVLVESVELVVRIAEVHVGREGPSGLAQPLAVEEAGACADIPVASGIVGIGLVDLGDIAGKVVVVGGVAARLDVASGTEVHLGLEQYRRVLAELVLHTQTETVAAGAGVVQGTAVVDEVVVLEVGRPLAALLDIVVAVVEDIVAAELHPVVEQVAGSVDAGHVRGRDSAVAAAAHHAPHHVAGAVRGALVVGVVAVEDEAYLGVGGEASDECVAEVPQVGVYLSLRGNVGTGAGRHLAEESAHHLGLHGKVDDRLLLTVVYAGELRLLGFLLDYLEAVDHLRGDVLGGQLGVVEEEVLTVDPYLRYGLSVRGDAAVIGNLNAGKLLEQVLKHVVVGRLERRGGIFHSVFLYDHGISDRGHGRRVEHRGVERQLYGSEVKGLALDRNFGTIGPVAHQVDLERVLAALDRVQRHASVIGRLRILADRRLPGRGQGDRGKAYRLARAFVDQQGLHRLPGLCKTNEPEKHQAHREEILQRLHYFTTNL